MTDTYDGRPPPVIPGNGGGYQGSPAPAPKKKSKMWIVWVVFSVAALVVLCGVLVTVLTGSLSDTPKPQKSAASSQRAVAPAPSKKVVPVPVNGFSDRDTPAQIGKDVPPGVYRVTKNVDEVSSGCFYTKSIDAEGKNIIDNGFLEVGRPQVTLKKGQWFHSQNCGTWQAVK